MSNNINNHLTGNTGEWSEVYVLLRLLADGKIYAADKDLNKLTDIYFPIIKIIRDENRGCVNEYITGDEIKICLNGEEIYSLPKSEFESEAEYLLTSMRSVNNKKSNISIEQTEQFMNKIKCYKLKAPSKDKTDITMKIIDVNTGHSPTVGFSIKSDLGASPTLLNAGTTTNFRYEVVNLQTEKIDEINNLKKGNIKDIKGRAKKIEEAGGQLVFDKMTNSTFEGNITLIDSLMDNIIAETLLYYYRDGITNCKDMVTKLEEENPLNYPNKNAYSYKFKKFLTAAALGMKPSENWDGRDEANGGYIIVTTEGNVLAYHIYNRDYFEEYLLDNTKYETGSTTRHQFGEIYVDNGKKYINYNLQVRFS